MRPMHRVLLADCPWPFNDRREVRRDNPERKPKFGTGVERRYEAGTMSIEDLCSLGPLIGPLCAQDAYGFLWVCESQPYAHLEVADAWGFDLINTFAAWLKTTSVSGEAFFGPGKYSAGNLERCLLMRRNKKRFPCWHDSGKGAYKPPQALLAPHPRDEAGKIIHSRKPEEVQDRIERWLGPHMLGMGMLELFATRHRPGWTCLGHKLNGRDIREDLAELAGGRVA